MLINFDSKDKNNEIIKSEMELLGEECKNIEKEDDAIKKAIELACIDFMARTEETNEKETSTLFQLLVSQNYECNSLVIILKDFSLHSVIHKTLLTIGIMKLATLFSREYAKNILMPLTAKHKKF